MLMATRWSHHAGKRHSTPGLVEGEGDRACCECQAGIRQQHMQVIARTAATALSA